MRSFDIVCPFCADTYPFPDNFDQIYRCQCGAVYKVAWRSDMEGAVNQLVRFLLNDRDYLEGKSQDTVLCHAVIYEDIQNLIRMKIEYEAAKYIRQVQSFDQNYPEKVGLVWLGNYKGMKVGSEWFHCTS